MNYPTLASIVIRTNFRLLSILSRYKPESVVLDHSSPSAIGDALPKHALFISSLLFILLVLVPTSEGKRTVSVLILGKNGTLSSPWLRTVTKKSRPEGCWSRPWACGQGEFPLFRRRCCWNRCIDIWTDPNHCGLCNIKCPFNWQCCRGRCRNINRNPFHCGKCFNRCPLFSRCRFGMCGYAQPWPKFPFPKFPFLIPTMPPTGWPPKWPPKKNPKRPDQPSEGEEQT